jgi:preprotein translocase subunit SecF
LNWNFVKGDLMDIIEILFIGIIIVGGIIRTVVRNNRNKNEQQGQGQVQGQGQGQGQRPPLINTGHAARKEPAKMQDLRERLEMLNQDHAQTQQQNQQLQLQKQQFEQQKRQAVIQQQQMERQKQQALHHNQQLERQKALKQQQLRSRGEIVTGATKSRREVATRSSLGLGSRRELAEAIVWSEILGKPKALRKGRL